MLLEVSSHRRAWIHSLEVITIALTTLLASCSSSPSRVSNSAVPVAYESTAPITRAPLLPPTGYAPSGHASAAGSAAEAERLGWHASPRWAAINGISMLVETDDTRAVAKAADPRSKFKEAKAKAAKVGVENLSDGDVEGLTSAQLKELRGY
jgi:type IV pilus biogenesis protein CpaD/CtpE